MNRPAHIEMAGGRDTRQRIWEAVRARRNGFTRLDIAMATDMGVHTIRRYIQALQHAGFVAGREERLRIGQEKTYYLARDNGLEAPRITTGGKPITQGLGQENVWRTLRIMGGEFSAAELAAMASTEAVQVDPYVVAAYLGHLEHAGYVTFVAMDGKNRRWRFNPTRNTGPRPPMIQKTKAVYDPNIDRVMWHGMAAYEEF
ncbi:hypothetical protein [Chromobacterium subtsugae]|uniref:hypothetical protein n=1 Tax=Chromobacterium subtsugae TaxID=251747 RepID=UPI0006412CBA|nr:hypothetical protein [Chromobacterium subtsugae]